MNKTEVKDDFIKYAAPMLEQPITQESIDEAFRMYIHEMFDQGEITYVQFTDWSNNGSGLTVDTISKRINESYSKQKRRINLREYHARYTRSRFGTTND